MGGFRNTVRLCARCKNTPNREYCSQCAWIERRASVRKTQREDLFSQQRVLPTIDDLAWAAGLFEGEGTVTLGTHNAPYVIVGNTDFQIIEFFQNFWPASIRSHNPANRNNNARKAWDWRAGGWKAMIFLDEVLPYIRTDRVKKKALVVISAYAVPSYERDAHVAQIRLLNHRGLVYRD